MAKQKSLTVWILTKRGKKLGYGSKRIKEEAEKRGYQVSLVHPDDFEVIEEISPPRSVIHRKKRIPLPDCVIPRMGSHTEPYAFSVIRMLEQQGVFVLNDADSIQRCKNKFRAIQILAKHKLPFPKTMLANFPTDIKRIKKEFEFPLILKILSGSQGKGVMLCDTPDKLEDIIGVLEDSPAEKPKVIFQEFMKRSRGKDVRVIVLGGKALGAMLRRAKGDRFKSNHSLGGTTEKIEMTREMEKLAVKSAKVMGLSLAGVDLLFDEKGYRICEVNSSPGFHGFESATKTNVAKKIVQFVEEAVKDSGSKNLQKA